MIQRKQNASSRSVALKYQFIDMEEKGMIKIEFTSVTQANDGLEKMVNN